MNYLQGYLPTSAKPKEGGSDPPPQQTYFGGYLGTAADYIKGGGSPEPKKQVETQGTQQKMMATMQQSLNQSMMDKNKGHTNRDESIAHITDEDFESDNHPEFKRDKTDRGFSTAQVRLAKMPSNSNIKQKTLMDKLEEGVIKKGTIIDAPFLNQDDSGRENADSAPQNAQNDKDKRKSMLNFVPGNEGEEINIVDNNVNIRDSLRLSGRHKNSQHDLIAVKDHSIIESQQVQDEEKQGTSGAINKQMYIDQYGVKFEIPSMYVQDSKFWKKDPTYCVQLVNYAVPDAPDYEVMTHYCSGKTEVHPVNDILGKDNEGGVVMRLIKSKDQQNFVLGSQLLKDVTNTFMKFSNDGSLFGYYEAENQQVRIIKIKNGPKGIEDLMNQININDFHAQYDGDDLDFIENIEFDINNRFFIGWGKKTLFLFNISSQKTKTYYLDTVKYTKIYALRFVSSSETEYQCMLGCHKVGINQICFFDAFMENQPGLRIHPHLTYFNEINKDAMVSISQNLKQFCFVNGDENFILEIEESDDKDDQTVYFTQKMLNQLKNKNVKYISPDPLGFFFVSSMEYDTYLDIQHSHRLEDFAVDFIRQIEPGIIKIFDFNVKTQIVDPKAEGLERGFFTNFDLNTKHSKNEIRISSLRDDEFLIDEAIYLEEITKKSSAWSFGQPTYVHRQLIPKYFSYKDNAIGALGFNWPYLSFSTLGNYIMVINVYDQKIVHRVEVAQKDIRIQIVDTIITDTNDLFIIIQQKADVLGLKQAKKKVDSNRYKLQMIDLDKSNIRENQNVNEHFIQEFIGEYLDSDVDFRQLLQVYVRGSSRKETVSRNEAQMVFLLHEGMLYSWTLSKDSTVLGDSKRIKLTEMVDIGHNKYNKEEKQIPYISTQKLYIQDSNTFYFQENIFKRDKWNMIVDRTIIGQVIKRVDILFNTYNVRVVYQQNVATASIISFNLDVPEKKLIILSGPPMKNQSNKEEGIKMFSIYCLTALKKIYDVQITQKEVIGRLTSGLFDVSNGHIYFGNNVIKIRYDLIKSEKKMQYKQKEIFDDYYGIIHIDKDAQIKSETPLNSHRAHRFAYMISNKVTFTSKLLLFLPYPHERRIYLHRKKTNSEYFYTTIETLYTAEKDHDVKIAQDGQFRHEGISDEIKKYNVLDNDEEKVIQDRRRRSSRVDLDYFRSIICMNQTEYKYYVYTLNGLLYNRIDFKDYVKKYGIPVATSMNGQNFIFKKLKLSLRKDRLKTNLENDKNMKQQLMTFSVMHLSAFGMIHVKDIFLMDSMEALLEANKVVKIPNKKLKASQKEQDAVHQNVAQILAWIIKQEFDQLADEFFEFTINDMLDVCIRINQKLPEKLESKEQYTKHVEAQLSTYYFEAGHYNVQKGSLPKSLETQLKKLITKTLSDLEQQNYIQNKTQNFYVTNDHQRKKFCMNNKYLFFYDRENIDFFCLNHEFTNECLDFVDFMVGDINKRVELYENVSDMEIKKQLEDEKLGNRVSEVHNRLLNEIKQKEKIQKDLNLKSYIKNLKMGSKGDRICIVVDQNEENDTIFIWDICQNTEQEAFDVEKNQDVIWDSKGNPQLITDSNVVLTSERCAVKVFSQQHVHRKNDLEHEVQFPLSFGHRFDGIGQNWLIQQEYISLGFSFMTFIIKDKIETDQKSLVGNCFDPEPYNYLRNRSTSFLDGQFVQKNYKELKNVLKNFRQIDFGLLDILTYPQFVRLDDKQQQNSFINLQDENKLQAGIKSALKIALDSGDNRNVDIILTYMSMVEFNSSKNFSHLFPQLLEYQSFITYLENLPVQTKQMMKKQTLKTNLYPHSQNIVQIGSSSSVQINAKYFEDNFGETYTHDSAAYPVRVVAMRIDDLINYNSGKKFLTAALHTGNLDIYKIPTMQIIIEFLYTKFRRVVVGVLVPIYILQIISFEWTLHQFENYRSEENFYDKMVEEIKTDPSKKPEMEKAKEDFKNQDNLKLAIGLNAVMIFLQFCFNLRMIIYMRLKWFKRYVSWIDICFSVINIFMILIIVHDQQDLYLKIDKLPGHQDNDAFNHQAIRILNMFGYLIIYSKSVYFLSLIDNVAPLIDIIVKIMFDIKWFIVVFVLATYSFIAAFHCLGLNQVQFDKIDDADTPPYSTKSGSAMYMWMLILGETNHDPFGIGEGDYVTQHQYLLYFLFILACFVLLITLLNMLIGIMGNSFSERNLQQKEIMIRDHLNFVVDNWHLSGLAFSDKKKIKYIITAFRANIENEQIEQLQNLQTSVERVNRTQTNIFESLKNIEQSMDNQKYKSVAA